MSLVEFLNQNGYTRISLTKSGVGHFHTNGLLNDHPISVLIDTGASSTVFSFDLARELNLPMTKLAMSGGGAGAAKLDIHQIQGARTKAQFIGDLWLTTLRTIHINFSSGNSLFQFSMKPIRQTSR